MANAASNPGFHLDSVLGWSTCGTTGSLCMRFRQNVFLLGSMAWTVRRSDRKIRDCRLAITRDVGCSLGLDTCSFGSGGSNTGSSQRRSSRLTVGKGNGRPRWHRCRTRAESLRSCRSDGGEGGIRTHGRLPATAVFKTAAFNRSATSPRDGLDVDCTTPVTEQADQARAEDPVRRFVGYPTSPGRTADQRDPEG